MQTITHTVEHFVPRGPGEPPHRNGRRSRSCIYPAPGRARRPGWHREVPVQLALLMQQYCRRKRTRNSPEGTGNRGWHTAPSWRAGVRKDYHTVTAVAKLRGKQGQPRCAGRATRTPRALSARNERVERGMGRREEGETGGNGCRVIPHSPCVAWEGVETGQRREAEGSATIPHRPRAPPALAASTRTSPKAMPSGDTCRRGVRRLARGHSPAPQARHDDLARHHGEPATEAARPLFPGHLWPHVWHTHASA